MPNTRQEQVNAYYGALRDKHNKEQSSKGANIARKGMNDMAQGYIIPAMKGISSFTPVGPAVGLTDAYLSYKHGDTTGAVIQAAAEAFPYVAKGIVKGAVKYGAPAISKQLGKIKVHPKLYKYTTHPETGVPIDVSGYHSVGKNNQWFKNDQFIDYKPDAYFPNKRAKFFSGDLAPTGISKTGKRSIYAPTSSTKTYKVTSRFENPLVVDGKMGYNRDMGSESFPKLLDRATAEGRDGVIVKNVWDNHLDDMYKTTRYMVSNNEMNKQYGNPHREYPIFGNDTIRSLPQFDAMVNRRRNN